MKLYTSYFAQTKNLSSYNKISIARFPPKWFPGFKDLGKFLAPSQELLFLYKAGKIDEEGYNKIYLEQLESLENEILDFLSDIEDESVLMCYEKPGEFCHRHILAKFIRERFLIDVEELNLGVIK